MQWDQSQLESYITNQIEESLMLEYKAAAGLDRSDSKKAEITKDVSAMANSAGGLLIYGIAEYQNKIQSHRPEKIDPINRLQFSKEWLEHIISNIRPKIRGLVIHSVSLTTSPEHVAYVVEIPQSSTAHQAMDKRYYKRFNFESVAMEDHEIRDVMGRGQYPKLELEFRIEVQPTQTSIERYMEHFVAQIPISPESEVKAEKEYILKVWAQNCGMVYAKYVNAFFNIPWLILHKSYPKDENNIFDDNGISYYAFSRDNTIHSFRTDGPLNYNPILPGLGRSWEFLLDKDFDEINKSGLCISYSIYADNAPPLIDSVLVEAIKVLDLGEP
jgi:hypothetical protein